ncbi:Fe-S cluster assembly sulfur transfer protein SufU [Buchananella hordeovulneris]|uniref:SUF system NifU family Fe-S cluster assembly protein n=1 Tax=Buchananella hordeovulneris TaxID=52770 RepID=A0A1Q5PY03_9ACTO|nr:SUF system NifU family Fe-S cluster assembly protein [Buchananella hordeovulneris]MDO5081296.1 SUF system NifU family Fe-S cluster assembly protein [Buchananella hordeovulneris]OKL52270.1 SUF system NifU family Fe-S cluster assembly protein [Buchananella hordeovulneris]RRD45539.1 SUF system NifU family Fe-S cluster assembly protein [Buchananella hordeovulneris]
MSDFADLYQQVILDHARRRVGSVRLAQPTGSSHQVNTTCGDEVDLDVVVRDGRLQEIGWQAEGCSISQASLSVLSELLVGRPVAEALALIDQFTALMHARGNPEGLDLEALEDGVAFTGVAKFPARIKCALLGWMAAKDAMAASGGEEGL